MPKYTCAIFDLDGTVLDTLDDLTCAVNHAMEAMHRPTHTREAVRAMVGNGVRVLIAKAMGEGALAEDVDAALAVFRKYYAENIDVYTREYEGVTAMLQRLRAAGMTLCVCSNKYDAAVQELIATHFPGLFDVVVGEGGNIPRKPDPAGTMYVINKAGADASTTCFIGDSYNDFAAARNAGLDAILVSWGFAPRAELATYSPAVLCDTMARLESAILAE